MRRSKSSMPATELPISTDRGSRCCLRAKASSRWTSATPRSAACKAPCSSGSLADSCRSADRQNQVADHDRQQIVEIVRDPSGQLTDGLELLRLAQRRLGGLMFRDFGLQAKIGLVQLKPQPHGFGKEPVELSCGERQRGCEDQNHRRQSLPVAEPSQKNRTAIGKLADSRKARRVGRCEALTTTAPAHMPPITNVRKICPATGTAANRTTPPAPQHRARKQRTAGRQQAPGRACVCPSACAAILSPQQPAAGGHQQDGGEPEQRGIPAPRRCSTTAVMAAFTALTASAIGICRNSALSWAARTSRSSLSAGMPLDPKAIRLPDFAQDIFAGAGRGETAIRSQGRIFDSLRRLSSGDGDAGSAQPVAANLDAAATEARKSRLHQRDFKQGNLS